MHDQLDPKQAKGHVVAFENTSRKRRRLITAATGGMGVLLSVSAKTALGSTICQSPSAMISGNTSPRPGNDKPCDGGLSPGFWVQPQKAGYWGLSGASFPTFKTPVVPCAPGVGKLSLKMILDPGTLIESVFAGGASSYVQGEDEPLDPGLWAVLFEPHRFGANGQLLRHLTAAWLNAGYFQHYPLHRTQIREMWLAVRNGGYYCPSSMVDCGALGMTALQVQHYIDGMYNDTDLNMPNLCAENEP